MKRDSLYYTFASGTALAISGLTTFNFALHSGAALFSFVTVWMTIGTIAIDLLDFGGCAWSSRNVSAKSHSTPQYFRLLKSRLRISIIITLLGASGLAFMGMISVINGFLILYPTLWLVSNYIDTYFLAKQHSSISGSLLLIDRSTWLFLFISPSQGHSYTLFFLLVIFIGLCIHITLGLILVLSVMEKSVKPEIKNSQKTKYRFLIMEHKYFGIISSISNFEILDSAIVSSICGLSGSASFAMFGKFKNPLMIGFQTFAKRLMPVAAARERSSIIVYWRDNRYILATNILALIACSLFSLPLMGLFVNVGFYNIKLIFFLGCLTCILQGFSSVLISQLATISRDKIAAKNQTFRTILVLFSVAIGALFLGEVGAVMGSLISNAIVLLVLTIITIREFERLPK